jgi:hypothetical protein
VGPGKSLSDKATEVRKLAAGKKAAACGTLGAFINEVTAQEGKNKTEVPDPAALLIEGAKLTRDEIPAAPRSRGLSQIQPRAATNQGEPPAAVSVAGGSCRSTQASRCRAWPSL